MRRKPLLLQFADCVPVVITARGGGRTLLAVLHAGRKGLMRGVVTNGAAFMLRMQGKSEARVGFEDVTVAIGPSIGPCCYEVDAETARMFAERFGETTVSKNHLDLRLAVRRELELAGIPPGDIHLLDICTACDSDFYSYRRDGAATGRQGALAWLE
jgi:YfiH family protein